MNAFHTDVTDWNGYRQTKQEYAELARKLGILRWKEVRVTAEGIQQEHIVVDCLAWHITNDFTVSDTISRFQRHSPEIH
jgi:hypothetical protein